MQRTLPSHLVPRTALATAALRKVLYRGRAFFCEAILRSPLKADGHPHPRAATLDGAVLGGAARDKKKNYWDIQASPFTELLVLGCEVGGRWNGSALEFVHQLAELKATGVTAVLRRATAKAYRDRWWSMLGLAVQGALAASLLARSGRNLVLDSPAAFAPDLEEVLDAQRWA